MMRKGGHTLLIDGNYFLHSRLFVLPRPKNGVMLEDEASRASLMRKLAIDLASEVRKMRGFIDKVVVAVDARSWRKDLFPTAEYKGTRKADSSIDWNAVYNVYEEFQNILQKHGVVVHKIEGAEADDVLFGWSTLLINKGRNSIIWTGDKDLIQLVNYSKANDSYSLWYSPVQKSLYCFKDFINVLDTSETTNTDDLLFNLSTYSGVREEYKIAIKDWIQSNKVKLTEVNCDEFMFNKLLIGDKSDNIPSVVLWQKEMKGGKLRTYSITDKLADKIFQQYNKENSQFVIDQLFNKDEIEKLADVVYRVIGKSSIAQIKNNISQNMSLMMLHTKVIPDAIQNEIYSSVESELKVLEGTDLSQLTNKEKILEGTGWLKVSQTPKQYDAFSNIPTETKQPKKLKLVGKKTNKKLF
jgi:5'-3' exonuclease